MLCKVKNQKLWSQPGGSAIIAKPLYQPRTVYSHREKKHASNQEHSKAEHMHCCHRTWTALLPAFSQPGFHTSSVL